MNDQNRTNESLNFTGMLHILYKWRRQLIIVTLAAMALGFVFTRPFFMPDYFESTGVIYPSNILPFSMESPTETILQIIQSEDIKDQLVIDFDLYKHYGVDPKSPTQRKELYEQLNANISFNRTAYESIDVTVADKNPKIAAQMVDSIVAHLNMKVRNLHASKFLEVVKNYKGDLDLKRREIDSLELLAQKYAEEYGIVDFNAQLKEVTRAYFRNGNDSELKQLYKNFQAKGIAAMEIREMLFRKYGFYAEAQNKYEQALRDYNRNFTHSHVVTKPSVSETKSFPHRTIITGVFTISVLFFSVLVVFWIEHYRKNIAPVLSGKN